MHVHVALHSRAHAGHSASATARLRVQARAGTQVKCGGATCCRSNVTNGTRGPVPSACTMHTCMPSHGCTMTRGALARLHLYVFRHTAAISLADVLHFSTTSSRGAVGRVLSEEVRCCRCAAAAALPPQRFACRIRTHRSWAQLCIRFAHQHGRLDALASCLAPHVSSKDHLQCLDDAQAAFAAGFCELEPFVKHAGANNFGDFLECLRRIRDQQSSVVASVMQGLAAAGVGKELHRVLPDLVPALPHIFVHPILHTTAAPSVSLAGLLDDFVQGWMATSLLTGQMAEGGMVAANERVSVVLDQAVDAAVAQCEISMGASPSVR